METVSLDCSLEEDDDTYLNSVAKLKALREQSSRLENQSVEVENDELKNAVETSNDEATAPVTRRQSRRRGASNSGRDRKRETGPRTSKQRYRQRRGNTDHDSDLEIVSVEEVETCEVKSKLEDSLNLNEKSIELSDEEEEDYDINIKVLWRSKDLHRLSIHKNENFQKIFQYFADLEGVTVDEILITKKEKTVRRNDTPASINLSVIDILDGGIVRRDKTSSEINPSVSVADKNSCLIKVQTTDKKTFTCKVKRNEDFRSLVTECARYFEVGETKIRLLFDGEVIDVNETPESLDIEDEACFDLRIAA